MSAVPKPHSTQDDFARVRKTLALSGSIVRTESLDALGRIEEQLEAAEQTIRGARLALEDETMLWQDAFKILAAYEVGAARG